MNSDLNIIIDGQDYIELYSLLDHWIGGVRQGVPGYKQK
jgi:hypothetical protein